MALNPTHNGVQLPDELVNASRQKKDAYAAKVRKGNRAFLDAYWKLEDKAAELGIVFHESEGNV